jgi:hypothetical protein
LFLRRLWLLDDSHRRDKRRSLFSKFHRSSAILEH